MASWISLDGAAVDRPVERKARGRSLSLERALRLRDLIGALLVRELGLSVPDARAVLSLCPMTEQHLRRRLKQLPPNVQRIFRELDHDHDHDRERERGHGNHGAKTRLG